MATAPDAALVGANAVAFDRPLLTNKILLILGIAAVIAIMAGSWMWSQQPDYRILFSNYSDKDGGAIVAALEQLNIPYKFTEGGGAIQVPAAMVHEARLKLASQGLPKGGNMGFELLENQKFGVSQFVEQVNFQRAMEGELERSIQSIAAVQVARIHLAIPKPSVFVREQQKPTASVLLNLHPGRSLDPQQVSAIVHLVASSVPELAASSVTVVDQNGNLLSDSQQKTKGNSLDASQLKYVDEMQQQIARRVEAIIAPIVGASNVHAEANAEIDFSTSEQANESYKPNQTPDSMVIRSMQTSESRSSSAGNGGIPGAASNQPLSNTPPANGTAPVAGAAAADSTAAASSTPMNTQKNATTNYEVDKTVRYTQQGMGGIKRVSVAVVVNYKQEKGKDGKPVNRALSDDEKKQIVDLAKQAMGYNEARGDSLTVVNSSFVGLEREVLPELPVWKQPDNIDMAKQALRILLGLGILAVLYLKLLKPMLNRLIAQPPAQQLLAVSGAEGIVTIDNPQGQRRRDANQSNLESTKQIARENPKMVASVITNWVSSND